MARGGPLDFKALITVSQAIAFGDKRPESELTRNAMDNSECSNCDNPVWRYGGCGLCFPCTTGESDASGDYELDLIVVPRRPPRRAPASSATRPLKTGSKPRKP